MTYLRGSYRFVKDERFLLLSFIFPFTIRLIPELIAGPWPLGFDTIASYAPFVREVQTYGLGPALTELLTSSHQPPAIYFLLGLLAYVPGASPFSLVKSLGPTLYGLMGFTMYFFAIRGLRWNKEKSFLLSLVAALYFVPLRLSWDLYKNTLGYSFFLLALVYMPRSVRKRDLLFVGIFGGLSVLSNELTAVLLGLTSAAFFCHALATKKQWNSGALISTFSSSIGVLFYLGVLFQFPPQTSPLLALQGRSIFPYNYVGTAIDPFIYPVLGQLYLAILLLTLLMIGPLLPFALSGFLRDSRLTLWIGVLVVESFSVIASPYAAIPFWYRWLMMLVVPLLILAVNGLVKAPFMVRGIFLSLLVFSSVAYLCLPPESAFPYFSNTTTLNYLPSSMLQNTVPIQDSSDVVASITWLNDMRYNNSVVVAPDSFAGWAQVYLDRTKAYSYLDPSEVTNGNFTSYEHVFLVYWAPGQRWFSSESMPPGSIQIHQSGKIAIYCFMRSVRC